MRRLLPMLTVLGVLAALLVGAAVPARSAVERRTERELLPGVRHVTLDQDGPDLLVNVARVAATADVDLRVVSAHDQVAGGADGGRELTSDMCRRADGLVCVNGDFAECPTCGQPIGGLVRDGRVLRSFHSAHAQLSVDGQGGFTTTTPRWAGRLVATYSWPREPTAEQRLLGEDPGHHTETRTLDIDALNRSRGDGATVVFTPEWAPATGTDGGFEAVLGTPEGVRPGATPVSWRGAAAGGSAIPLDGVVVSAAGADEQALRSFWDEWHGSDAESRSVVLETSLEPGVLASIGAHPVLLRDGQRQALNGNDNKVAARHPRTLAGWTADRELLLVTVDGRQRGHSQGLTLREATDLMVRLGATDAVNLDGGGASTFVGPCEVDACVLNRPSDGRERHVTTALVVAPRSRVTRTAAAPVMPIQAATPPVPQPIVVESTAQPVVEEPPAAEPLPTPVADAAAPEPEVTPAGAGPDEVVTPHWPRGSALAATRSPDSRLADPEAPVRTATGLAVLAVLADVAALAFVNRRRLQPLVAQAWPPLSGRLGA